ncbi:hypothetical protein Y1Q_0012076 [Alligator mississippiensis]|uniref:Uncharacterized protein n=1 Tax=Alligator mississippiensis TaxID=8496 RepID=A0A151P5L2_ALLMI|nr:hypothetical protein Y1Q_0012076 [Alligator mississippiensis]
MLGIWLPTSCSMDPQQGYSGKEAQEGGAWLCKTDFCSSGSFVPCQEAQWHGGADLSSQLSRGALEGTDTHSLFAEQRMSRQY